MVAVALIALWVARLMAGDSPTGRWLNNVLIEAPASWLNRLGRGHLILAFFIVIAAFVAARIGPDGIKMLAMIGPDAVAWIATFDAAIWLDVLAATAIATSLVRWRAIRDYLCCHLCKPLRPITLRRARPRRRRAAMRRRGTRDKRSSDTCGKRTSRVRKFYGRADRLGCKLPSSLASKTYERWPA